MNRHVTKEVTQFAKKYERQGGNVKSQGDTSAHPPKWLKINKLNNTKCWRGCKANTPAIHWLVVV